MSFQGVSFSSTVANVDIDFLAENNVIIIFGAKAIVPGLPAASLVMPQIDETSH
jgi:hypothetical protein